VKLAVSIIANTAVLALLLALVVGAALGAWQLLPEASRVAITRPAETLAAAQRGVQSGPTNPIAGLSRWLMEWLAERRDLVDVVRTADGTDGGIAPLPAWTSVDSRRVFGVTETLWQSRRARLAGARWSRVVFYWADIQPRSSREWRAGYYLRDDLIERERRNGIEVVGLLMNTPAWAAARPADGVRSVPAGLSLPVDDPRNHWATFVRKMASSYKGRIDTWIIWNEPDIRPGGPNAMYYSWAGDERDYALLLKTAYLAARQANPGARIVFAGTTYWADANAGQPLFLERALAVLASDPDARAHGFYFDAVALNLYTSPDDLVRVAGVYREVLGRYGLHAPLWLTETNAVPYDDPTKGLRREPNGLRVTMDEQASFVVQAFAMALAAGYERVAFHAMADRDTQDELWGLVRNDGSLRPAFVAYQTATRYLGGAERAAFVPLPRREWRWAPGGYHPNWQIYLVVVERAAGTPWPQPTPVAGTQPTPAPTATSPADPRGRQRVSVVWNGDPQPLDVLLPRLSERAALIDKYGRLRPLEPDGDRWRLTLPGATAHSPLDPDGYYFIGGDPLLLVEESVPDGAPVTPPVIAS
jgi:hypothetical protein